MGKDKGLEEAGEGRDRWSSDRGGFMSGGVSYPLEDADHCWHGGQYGS